MWCGGSVEYCVFVCVCVCGLYTIYRVRVWEAQSIAFLGSLRMWVEFQGVDGVRGTCV